MFSKVALLGLAFAGLSVAQISDDFENGWDQTKWPIYAPDCSQGGSIALDSTTAHSGKNSIKVTGAGGYCGHIFFGTSSVPSGDVYVRAWVKASKALTASHVSFITMPDSSLGANKHLRIGGQSNILMYNRESDDATLPDLSPQGIAASAPLPTGSFQCFEYHLASNGNIETWLNGTPIPGLTTPNPNGAQWARGAYTPKIQGVYFGWESYGGDANTFWYDDVSISSTRVGCGGTPPPPPPSSTIVQPPPTSTVRPTSSPVVSTPRPSSTMITTVRPASSSVRSSSAAAPTSTPSTGGCTAAKYAQCGGLNYSGCKTCAAGSTCKYSNDWYSQCL